MDCHLDLRSFPNNRGAQIRIGGTTIVLINGETGIINPINPGPAAVRKEELILMFPDTMGKTVDLVFGMSMPRSLRMTGVVLGLSFHGIGAVEIIPMIRFLGDRVVVLLKEKEGETWKI
jgi:hypothetical protein